MLISAQHSTLNTTHMLKGCQINILKKHLNWNTKFYMLISISLHEFFILDIHITLHNWWNKQQKTWFYLLDIVTIKIFWQHLSIFCQCKIHFKSYAQKLHSVKWMLVKWTIKNRPLVDLDWNIDNLIIYFNLRYL